MRARTGWPGLNSTPDMSTLNQVPNSSGSEIARHTRARGAAMTISFSMRSATTSIKQPPGCDCGRRGVNTQLLSCVFSLPRSVAVDLVEHQERVLDGLLADVDRAGEREVQGVDQEQQDCQHAGE